MSYMSSLGGFPCLYTRTDMMHGISRHHVVQHLRTFSSLMSTQKHNDADLKC